MFASLAIAAMLVTSNCEQFSVEDGAKVEGEIVCNFGTYDAAMAIAHTCETPTSWVEHGERNGRAFWYAVCGTADGRVCGRDVPWTDYACQMTGEDCTTY